MQTLWKQQQPPHPSFDRLNRCLIEDWFLLPFELRLNRAHAQTLRAAGILTDAEHGALVAALSAIEREFATAPCPASNAEDLHTWLEAQLVERAGPPGRKIHTARSRNDQIATLLKLFVIDAGDSLHRRLAALVRVAAQRALDWRSLPCPLHTHQQFAAIGTIGFWMLRYATAFDRLRRDLQSTGAAWRRECPLGSGAVAGSSIPIDRRLQARALGFEKPSDNALDATCTRDECLDLLALAAKAALHLQSLAVDLLLFSQTPLAWTRYPAAFATGSSMMPNKSNPDALELLRGHACELIAAHGHACLLLKGLPAGYNRDLQCLKPIVNNAATRLDQLLEMTTAFIEQLDFNEERIREHLRLGGLGATLAMEQRVKEGAALRDAHHATAGAIHSDAASVGPPGDPAEWISLYQTIGSAHPDQTRAVAEKLLSTVG